MADTELDDAIASATEEITKEIPPKDDKVEDAPDDTSNEVVDDKVEDDDLNEDQLKEARILYKSLLDPQQRLNIVAALAAQSGLLTDKTPLKTEKQIEKVEQGIADIIKEALPEFPGLTDKLAPAIQKIIENEREARETEMQQVHLDRVQTEVDSELAVLARETKGESKKLENKMAALMQEVSPGPNVTVKSYIRTLYTLATAGSNRQKTTAQIADKINRNANNAPDRIKTAPGSDRTSNVPDKKMSLNDSVNWAIEQASKGVGKR